MSQPTFSIGLVNGVWYVFQQGTLLGFPSGGYLRQEDAQEAVRNLQNLARNAR